MGVFCCFFFCLFVIVVFFGFLWVFFECVMVCIVNGQISPEGGKNVKSSNFAEVSE